MNEEEEQLESEAMKSVFGLPRFEKPRSLRQTWLKDVGFDEAPNYVERMGLAELPDFLAVAAERLDYVKIVTTQVINSPADWLQQKVATYQRHGVEPYLDHTFFMGAYQRGVVEKALEAARELGFRVVEFMNTAEDISAAQWASWRALANELGMRVVFEHHPLYNWDQSLPRQAASADDILREAEPFLADGAFALMIDHDELELQGERAAEEIGRVVAALGLELLVFEATSPKEGPMIWRDNLKSYFRHFGADCNVANVMPSQALYVETLRAAARTG